MVRVLLLIAALIAYGSLYPWDFHFRPIGKSPLVIFLNHWPSRLNRFTIRDLGINLLLYLPLGAAGFLALSRRFRMVAAMALAVLMGAMLSTAVETLQIFDRGRTASAFDIACNVLGTMAGVWLAAGFEPQIERALAGRTGKWRSSPGAFALLAVWMGFQLYPLFPALGTYHLRAQLRGLAGSGWSLTETLFAAAEWLCAGLLVEAVVGERLARSRFALLLLAVPARLLIVWRGPTLPDFLGAAAALALFFTLPRTPAVRCRAGAAILTASLVLRELAPFHWSGEINRFTWIPFGGVLNADWPAAARVLLRKTYDYGSAVWMIRMAGIGFSPAVATVSITLAVLEAVQLRLPGRTPEITDPVLALVVAAALGWLERDPQRARQRGACPRRGSRPIRLR